MWIILSFSVLSALMLIVILRNLIIRCIITKKYKSITKKKLYKQILGKSEALSTLIKNKNVTFKIKSNIWATKIKVYFTLEISATQVINGTIFFSNVTTDNAVNENLEGVLLGKHEKWWI